MARHEKRCTMNPYRHCGMCAILDLDQTPMPELLAILPDVTDCWIEEELFQNEWGRTFIPPDSLKDAFANLREKTENCPACLLAALRQKGIPVGAMEGFDFKQECESWWGDFNAEHNQPGYCY